MEEQSVVKRETCPFAGDTSIPLQIGGLLEKAMRMDLPGHDPRRALTQE